ncbi:MAG TPA: helix-hairpin-helix domain-containing protein [Acidimicrobiia bacterium]|nr:helix-hairpin-helix domain-containing protein [Acidimicrobiia bacterium]
MGSDPLYRTLTQSKIKERNLESFKQFKANNFDENQTVITRPLPTSGSTFKNPNFLDQTMLKVIGVMIVVGISAGYLFAIQTNKSSASGVDSITITAPKQDLSTTTKPLANIKVYVAGAVNTPGVIELEEKSRVVDAIDKAGGALGTANLIKCNLAAFVTDGSTIYVPSNISVLDATQSSGCGIAQSSSSEGPGGSGSAPGKNSKVNLNLANQTELETLPGIGPAMATAIISYRTKSGNFQTVNDLRKVKGIGDKKFADLKDLVST